MAARRAALALAALPPALAFTYEKTLSSPPRLPKLYSSHALASHYMEQPFTVLSRLVEVTSYIPRLVVDPSPENLTNALTSLGPAFIKFGQQLSIRPDLLPPEYLPSLSTLTDNCPSFSTATAHKIIEAELRCPLTTVFPDGLTLVAAASLGQVYKGTLKQSGIMVAVKVQRPDVRSMVSLDLFIVHFLSALFDFTTVHFRHRDSNSSEFTALVETFAAGSYSELDYVNEAKQQIRFKEGLKPMNINVHIPDVHFDYSTGRIITTSWIDGIKLSSCTDAVINKLIPVGVELFLAQLLDLGMFHADPHPGNMLVQVGKDGEPQLTLIDFGLTTSISDGERRAMTAAIYHLLTRDFGKLIKEDTVKLGFLKEGFGGFEELTPVLDNVIRKGMEGGSDMRKRRRQFREISGDLNQIFFDYPFTVPPFFALITRGLGLLEGIALKGDSEFDIFTASYPFAIKKGMALGLKGAFSGGSDGVVVAASGQSNS